MQLTQISLALAVIAAAVFLLSDRKDMSARLGLDGLFDFVGSLDAGKRFDPARPETLLAKDVLGDRLDSPGLALADGRVALVTDALSFFENTAGSARPARTATLPETEGCAFRPPRPGERIGNVHVGYGGQETPILALSDAGLAGMTLSWVRAQQGRDAIVPPRETGGDRLIRVVDVVVTETARPVYLILQSGWGDVIWNIQKSPGARLAHVAVVAGGEAGIAGLDPGASAEVLSVARNPDCAVRPARRPTGRWQPVEQATARAGSAPEETGVWREYLDAFSAYDRWFQQTFGIASEQDVIGQYRASHVLIGPLPAPYEKIAHTTLDGAALALPPGVRMIAGSAEERRAALGDLITGLATAAAGGDLARLRPAPQTRGE